MLRGRGAGGGVCRGARGGVRAGRCAARGIFGVGGLPLSRLAPPAPLTRGAVGAAGLNPPLRCGGGEVGRWIAYPSVSYALPVLIMLG